MLGYIASVGEIPLNHVSWACTWGSTITNYRCIIRGWSRRSIWTDSLSLKCRKFDFSIPEVEACLSRPDLSGSTDLDPRSCGSKKVLLVDRHKRAVLIKRRRLLWRDGYQMAVIGTEIRASIRHIIVHYFNFYPWSDDPLTDRAFLLFVRVPIINLGRIAGCSTLLNSAIVIECKHVLGRLSLEGPIIWIRGANCIYSTTTKELILLLHSFNLTCIQIQH